MTDIVLPLLLSAFDSFPNMIYQAAGSNGTFCYFDPTSYNQGYSYYAMWDSLDCRIGYYMGAQNNNYGYILGGLLLSGKIFAFLYALAFIILLLSISLNIITLIIYFFPLIKLYNE
jgi:type IV secretory pathway VirB6-like protein